ncbi:prosaposin isoform X2 [Adelges cooleyi]|uniref:prosaposin isoform X2 n=1 Tax=Adelges cooleyi TaxID=133065 RepID=UPI00218049F5|nr:prosaposin isoform X2 [Adelges cooleyi]
MTRNDVLRFFALACLGCVLLGACSAFAEEPVRRERAQLLGEKECTSGPAYWCRNITNAAGCKAVNFCIQTTWLKQKYPEDNDDVCTICKNMVKEARDTLTSNATLDELQQVFYGSCNLLPLKIVKKECRKLADDFIPELVDTLSSEMDPNVVCTVAGLCNNKNIDQLLLENKNEPVLDANAEVYHSCEKCAVVMEKAEIMMQLHSKRQILNKIWTLCGELSSFSDACSAIVLKNIDSIYDTLKTEFTKRNVCMLSGMCSEAFHPHADGYEKAKSALMGVEISTAGERGIIKSEKKNKVNDELTCEFCEQLVKHLRDILISNSTEEQFLDVLKGLCKQTGAYSQECLSLVVQNYKLIYTFLTSELDGKVVCTDVGICPNSLSGPNVFEYKNLMPFPLIPTELLEKVSTLEKEEHMQSNVKSPVIDVYYQNIHLKIGQVDMPKEKTTCFVCQSVLHYVQQVVTDPKSEAEIRSALESSCKVLPNSLTPECKQFVDQYGDAFISLVAQEVDPSVICPELKLCPAQEISIVSTVKSSQSCTLCVMFMSTLESELKNKDNEVEIIKKLEKLCSKFPSHYKAECTAFVENNFQSLVDMIIAQLNGQDICTLLNVCKPPQTLFDTAGDIETNMIAETNQAKVIFPGLNLGQLITNNYQMPAQPKVPTPLCLVCTVLMKYLNRVVEDKSNQASIKNALDTACSVLPNIEENECKSFVDGHFAQIMAAIETGTSPEIACMAMLVCVDGAKVHGSSTELQQTPKATAVQLDQSSECVICEAFVKTFEKRFNESTESNIEEFDLVELCDSIEVIHKDECLEMIPSYDQTFKNLYYQVPTWMMCEKMTMCDKNKSTAVNQLENENCLLGSTYWCSSKDNAKQCKADKICERSTWKVQIIEN